VDAVNNREFVRYMERTPRFNRGSNAVD
jgi:hypothetical protein